jgi:hypothetical protein
MSSEVYHLARRDQRRSQLKTVENKIPEIDFTARRNQNKKANANQVLVYVHLVPGRKMSLTQRFRRIFVLAQYMKCSCQPTFVLPPVTPLAATPRRPTPLFQTHRQTVVASTEPCPSCVMSPPTSGLRRDVVFVVYIKSLSNSIVGYMSLS